MKGLKLFHEELPLRIGELVYALRKSSADGSRTFYHQINGICCFAEAIIIPEIHLEKTVNSLEQILKDARTVDDSRFSQLTQLCIRNLINNLNARRRNETK